MSEAKYYKYTIQIPIECIIETEYNVQDYPYGHQFEKESVMPIKDSKINISIESSERLDQSDIEYKLTEIFEKLIEFPDKARKMFRELGY